MLVTMGNFDSILVKILDQGYNGQKQQEARLSISMDLSIKSENKERDERCSTKEHDGGELTFSASHGVKEELGRSESGEIGILDESSRLGTVIVFDEVRKGSMAETERNTLTLDVLLTHTSNNLGGTEKGKDER